MMLTRIGQSKITKVTLLLALIFGLVSCGKPAATNSASTPTDQETSPQQDPSTTTPVSYPYVLQMQMTGSGGYSAALSYSRGAFGRATPNETVNGDTLGSACQVDDQTDAVEPFEAEITNTTSSFDASPEVILLMGQGYWGGVTWNAVYDQGSQTVSLSFEEFFSDGPVTFPPPGGHLFMRLAGW